MKTVAIVSVFKNKTKEMKRQTVSGGNIPTLRFISGLYNPLGGIIIKRIKVNLVCGIDKRTIECSKKNNLLFINFIVGAVMILLGEIIVEGLKAFLD